MLNFKLINFFKDFGERPTLFRNFEEINSDLQFAYQFTAKLVKDKSVLDFGCGGGYGTEYLSRFTKKTVVGYDISEFATSSASHFFHKSNLHFQSILPSEKFDIIVSFQVVEHIKPSDLPVYFKSIISRLKRNGQVLFATPNKNITSYKLKTPIFAFHTVEYSPESFTKLLKKYFKEANTFGQLSQDTAVLVKNHQFSYDNLSAFSIKHKVMRFLSQIKPIRYLTGHIPQELKNLILGQTRIDTTPQIISSDKIMVDNSYILIAQCRL